jgi:hypothetical protein
MNTQQIQQKYSYELDSTEGIYKVWHTENNWSTLIAMCKDAEKADFICKAANQFSLERYEAATTGELPATAIDLEHFLDYVGLNYTPVRFTDGVLWDLDDSEAPMSSEEVIQDYKEQFGSTPVAPKEEGEPAPVPQWVSVEDRLPYKDGNSEIFCLVWDTYEGHAIVRPYNEYHKCWDGEDADDFYTDATDGNISHWMPLPSTPVGAAPKEPGE